MLIPKAISTQSFLIFIHLLCIFYQHEHHGAMSDVQSFDLDPLNYMSFRLRKQCDFLFHIPTLDLPSFQVNTLMDQVQLIIHALNFNPYSNSQANLHTLKMSQLRVNKFHEYYITKGNHPFISRFNPNQCRINIVHNSYRLGALSHLLKRTTSFGFGYDEYSLYIVLRNASEQMAAYELISHLRPTTSPIYFVFANNGTNQGAQLLKLCQICREENILLNVQSSSLQSSIDMFGESGRRNFNGNVVQVAELDDCDKNTLAVVTCKPLTRLVMTAGEHYNFSVISINFLRPKTEEEIRLGKPVAVYQALNLRLTKVGVQEDSIVLYGATSYLASYCERKLRYKGTHATFWLEPYDMATWTLLILVVMILAILFGKFKLKSSCYFILELWRMLCNQDYVTSKHFMFFIFGPSFMILSLHYEAIITSVLTKPSPPATFKNFGELSNRSFKILAETITTPGGGVQVLTEENLKSLRDYSPQYISGFIQWIGNQSLSDTQFPLFFELFNAKKCGVSRRSCFENPSFDLALITPAEYKQSTMMEFSTYENTYCHYVDEDFSKEAFGWIISFQNHKELARFATELQGNGMMLWWMRGSVWIKEYKKVARLLQSKSSTCSLMKPLQLTERFVQLFVICGGSYVIAMAVLYLENFRARRFHPFQFISEVMKKWAIKFLVNQLGLERLPDEVEFKRV